MRLLKGGSLLEAISHSAGRSESEAVVQQGAFAPQAKTLFRK
jgi:hypothetical protein